MFSTYLLNVIDVILLQLLHTYSLKGKLMMIFNILIISSLLLVASGSTIQHYTALLCQVMHLNNFTFGNGITRFMIWISNNNLFVATRASDITQMIKGLMIMHKE